MTNSGNTTDGDNSSNHRKTAVLDRTAVVGREAEARTLVSAEQTLAEFGGELAPELATGNDWFVNGALLRRTRERVGLKQSEIAKRLGYSRQQVSAWEADRHRIPLEAYRRFCDVILAEQKLLDEYGKLLAEIGTWPTIGKLS